MRSEAEAEEETRRARQSISAIPGINDLVAGVALPAGFKSAEEIADSELEEILDVEGVSKDKAEALHASRPKEYVAEKRKKEQEAQAAAQATAAAVAKCR